MVSHCRRKSHEHDAIGHGKPWVYFMVDSFFLITVFFVTTFQVRTNELALPNELSAVGGTKHGDPPRIEMRERLPIHVSMGANEPIYEIQTRRVALSEVERILLSARESSANFRVVVSYDRDVQFGSVMAVFNICSRHQLGACSLATAGPR